MGGWLAAGNKQPTKSAAMTMGALRTLAICSAMGFAAAGINLDDHFTRSTRITSSNMLDDKVKQAVDGGKTLFVRIIASEG